MTLRPLDAIAAALPSKALIEASAGTGKTFTITTLYVRLVLEAFEARQILVVTYTNAATAELRDRVRGRLRQALEAFDGGAAADETLARLVAVRRGDGRDARDRRLLLQALRSFDEAAIFTIHGFCRRMLQDHAFESRVAFDAELVTDVDLLRDEIVRDFWARNVAPADRWFVEYLEREGIGFERLSKLARRAAENAKLEVIPREAGEAELEIPLAQWRRAWERAAQIWQGERERILDLLERPGVLHKRPFANSRGRFAPPLDVELSAERPWISKRFDDLRFLTPEALEEKTRVGRTAPRHDFFDACQALIGAESALEAAVRPHALRLELDLVEFARSQMAERKERANVHSFDDLLNRLDEALAGSADLAARIREKFPAALIDEFQDTDPVQYSIFRRIYLAPRSNARRDASFFLIGDPKQAVYSFRGADVFAYLRARSDAKDGEYTLGTNWRSDPRLIRAVNAIFGRAPRPFVFADIPFQAVVERSGASDSLAGSLEGVAPFEILLAPGENLRKLESERELARLVAAEISRFLQCGTRLRAEGAERAVEPGDVAVLCRTNHQARLTHEALQRLRVPVVLYGDSSVFDTDDAREVERVLRAMVEPGDQNSVRAALVTTLVGLDGTELEQLRDDERASDAIVAEFAKLAEIWRARGFVSAFRQMLESRGVETRLLRLIDGERRLTNVLHLGELLQKAALDKHLGPLALVEWLSRMRHDQSARGELAAEAAQIRLESDARRVKVTTVHQAKGLEYPVVYCPFLWTKVWDPPPEGFAFHDPRAGNARRLDIGSPERSEHARLFAREELAESLRLLYVAVTRAKHRCSIVWGKFADGGASALGYLLHRPADGAPGLEVADVTSILEKRIASPADFRSDLERIVLSAEGAIAVRDLPTDEGPPYTAVGSAADIMPARRAKRVLDESWRTSSFTRLAAGHGRISAVAEEGVDRDENEEEARCGEAPAVAEPPVLLANFPKGARAGELLHEVLEKLDFEAAATEVVAAVGEALGAHGFDVDAWKEKVTEALCGVLATPLGGPLGKLSLRDVGKDERVSEMEFVFPVAERGGRLRLTASRLATVLRGHGAPRARPGYAERVERLGFAPLAGFLRGFVDLVFEHDGRWYVVDWKSNFLGAAASAYAPSRLAAAMESHHYFLQCYLYAAALHRHLAARLESYAFARHFGGVYYLFVRGMSPRHPPGTGIFHDWPSAELIEELSAVLHGGGAPPPAGERPA